MATMQLLCRICGSTDADEPIILREMLFGTRESFEYFRCRTCDTLQIAEVPLDMERHYPASKYYSYTVNSKRLRDRILERLLAPRMLGRPLAKAKGNGFIARQKRKLYLMDWMCDVPGLSVKWRVLDYGCGNVGLIRRMASWGFCRPEGYDPFANSVDFPGGVRLHTVLPDDCYDLVMMHHSLEHVPDPTDALEEARGLLSERGFLMVRIPVRQGKAWRVYQSNWVHLDPPRHLYLWTVDGFVRWAKQNHFEVVAHGFDAVMFSLAGSYLIQNGHLPTDFERLPPEMHSDLEKEALELNASGDADTAYFVLKSAPA